MWIGFDTTDAQLSTLTARLGAGAPLFPRIHHASAATVIHVGSVGILAVALPNVLERRTSRPSVARVGPLVVRLVHRRKPLKSQERALARLHADATAFRALAPRTPRGEGAVVRTLVENAVLVLIGHTRAAMGSRLKHFPRPRPLATCSTRD